MKLFPQEYNDYATTVHKLAAVLSAIFIAGTIIGMVAFFVFKGFGLPLNIRKIQVFIILGGAPAGLILISLVNTSLSRRFRAHQLAVQSRPGENDLSASSRLEIVKSMPHTRYDYRNKSKSIFHAGIFMAIFVTLMTGALYTVYPYPKVLFAGACQLLIFAVLIGVFRTVLQMRWNGSITLTSEGIRFTKDGANGFVPWDSVKEIKTVRYGFKMRSDQVELMIWNEIGPADAPKTGFLEKFQIGERGSKKLIDQIKTMNPNIVHIEPFMTRALRLPVSDRTATKLILAVVIFFAIIIIISIVNR